MKRSWVELGIIVTIAAVGMAYMRQSQVAADADQEALYHYQLGARCYRQGEFRRGLGELSQALALKPDYRQAYRVRGLTWLASGARDRAMADFDNGLARPPSPWETWLFTGTVSNLHLDRARLELVEGDYEACLKDAEQAGLGMASQDVAACAKAGLGRWDDARTDLQYLDWGFTGADEKRYLVHLGGVYAHQGEAQEATRILEEWKAAGSPSPHGVEGPCFLCRSGPRDK